MTRTEIIHSLRPLRRELVTAAESVIKRAFEGGEKVLPAKTQFSRLVNLCGEASCSEEIENYLRYQAGRDVKKKKKEAWQVEFVKAVIEGVHGVLAKRGDDSELSEEQRDMCRVEAWRLYATYLTRAYTYEAASRDRRE